MLFLAINGPCPRDLDFDPLSELQRRGFAERDLDRENAGVDRAAGIFGTIATGTTESGISSTFPFQGLPGYPSAVIRTSAPSATRLVSNSSTSASIRIRFSRRS